MPDEYSLSTQDPLLGGISPDTQQVLAMVMAQLAAQNKQSDPVADYLKEMKRLDEEQKKQDALRSQNQSLSYPPNSSRSGGQNQSGFGNIAQVYNVADTISKGYNGENLISNVISLFG